MTEEQKAKLYDKALEKAKSWYVDAQIDFKKSLETLFPELKESEDERIRKELIKFLKLPHPQFVGNREHEKWIAWLEKQGEKDKLIQELGEYKVKYTQEVLSQHLEKYYADPYNGVYFDCYGHHWGMCARDCGIEIAMDGKPVRQFSYKDCEQTFGGKSALESIKEVKVDNSNSTNAAPFCYEHTIIAQKDFASKQEPKFKVGDWITSLVLGTARIIGVNDSNKYQLEYTDGKQVFSDIDYVIYEYDKWTIQDAKNGDVLVASDGSIFLFASVVDCACKYYVALTTDNYVKINKEVGGGYWETLRAVCPATKEQRDLLIQKMKEAGYEWDADRKVLREMENIIEIPFGIKDSELQEATYYIPKGFHAEIDDDKVVIKKGKKPAKWSEEDEKMVNDIIAAIDTLYYHGMVKWLKSLKQRIGG